jgi:fluoroquinolone transport system ATP-binding protein
MVKVEQLYHDYSGKGEYAVKGISFEIADGEIFGFLGPSGAGKSTTQNILTGLLPLQKGKAEVGGQDIRKPSPSFFNLIGVSFEQSNVYAKLTGLENLEFYRKLFSVPTEEPKKLLDMVGLGNAAKKRVSEYSKGMRNRLTFARSMINRPRMWFLDEPTTGLDPAIAETIIDIVQQRNKEGATVFLTTHNMHVADRLCDRVAFINNGQLLLVDSPRNLKLKYGQKLVEVEYGENGELVRETLSFIDEADRRKLGRIVESGNVKTMHTKEATLDQIFIQVTGRGLD